MKWTWSRFSDRKAEVKIRPRANPVVWFLAAVVLASWLGYGQEEQPGGQTPAGRQQTRAERQAEAIATLSADRVIVLLRQEPGLLLQVKKRLAQQAFEEGRVLGSSDLADDAIFQLMEQDDEARNLATREISERGYITVKPTPAELELKEELKAEQAREKRMREAAPERTATPPSIRSTSQQSEPFPDGPEPVLPETVDGDSRREPLKTEGAHPDWNFPANPPPGGSNQRKIRSSYQVGMETAEPPPEYRQPVPWRAPGTNSAWSTAVGQADNRADRTGQAPLAPPAAVDTGSPEEGGAFSLYHLKRPYENVPSLYDLYSKYSRRETPLPRFGESVFRNNTGNLDRLPADIPVGPDYIVGPGDGLTIDLWGGVSERLTRTVDREGRLSLPESGDVVVTGRSLGEVQQLVRAVLRRQFRDVEADVSLARLRTVRVYVVGDVQRPGAYDVSSLSTPLNALFLAGGPTARGSLRVLRHLRGARLVQEIDVYDLLLRGVRPDMQRLEPGDTIQVPPVGAEVTIEGYVRRPAVYELKGEKSLAEALALAGGVLASATLHHVDVEHVEAHQRRTTLQLDISDEAEGAKVVERAQNFALEDGDKIKVLPIFPYAERSVYLEGHVLRPGKFAYREGMKVADLIHSYNSLLPEPYLPHAEIIRLNPPDYQPSVLTFNLAGALNGDDQNLPLEPFDVVYIYGRFDFEDPPLITVTGEVRDPGDHLTHGVTHLRDAIYLAGGVTPDALLDDAQVFRTTRQGEMQVLGIDLAKALGGDARNNILLQPKDRVIVHRNPLRADPPMVSIQGEVITPGKYPLGSKMTAAALVRLAGGFRRGAYTELADLASYRKTAGDELTARHHRVRIAEALAGNANTDIVLHDGDVLTIGQIEGWRDVSASISLRGEVAHPGTYGILPGERLSSVLARAGGFSPEAFPRGTVFQRAQVRDLEERNRALLLREIRDQEPSLNLAPEADAQQRAAKEAVLQQWKSTLDQLQNTPPAGRLVIHISAEVRRWARTGADLPLRAGDQIYVPKRPDMVMVNGSVHNPTAVSYRPGKDAAWYLKQAGGPTVMANKRAMFVIRADGSVVGNSGGLFGGGFGRTRLEPGDMVVVPEKAFSSNTRWKTTLEGAQLAYAIGIAIQVARSF